MEVTHVECLGVTPDTPVTQPLLVAQEQLFIDLVQGDILHIQGGEIAEQAAPTAFVVLSQTQFVLTDEGIDLHIQECQHHTC